MIDLAKAADPIGHGDETWVLCMVRPDSLNTPQAGSSSHWRIRGPRNREDLSPLLQWLSHHSRNSDTVAFNRFLIK